MKVPTVPRRVLSLAAVSTLAVLAAASAVTACQKAQAETTPAPAEPVLAARAKAPPPVLADAPAAPPGMQSIPERFAAEAQHRPVGTLRAEDAFAAAQAAGVTLRETRQHLGAPFLAAYCVGAQAGADVHLSVCEYDSLARAGEGRAMSQQAFGTLPNRTLHANGSTTLTIRHGGASAGDREVARKIIAAFEGARLRH